MVDSRPQEQEEVPYGYYGVGSRGFGDCHCGARSESLTFFVYENTGKTTSFGTFPCFLVYGGNEWNIQKMRKLLERVIRESLQKGNNPMETMLAYRRKINNFDTSVSSDVSHILTLLKKVDQELLEAKYKIENRDKLLKMYRSRFGMSQEKE